MLLNDHRGQLVSAAVETLDRTLIMGCAGRLEHWHDEYSDVAQSLEERAEWRDELAGHYVVGETQLAVTESSFESAEAIFGGVSLLMRGGVYLVIRW